MDYFTEEEKRCPCCGLNLVDRNPRFLHALNTARELYGKPMDAVSMTRCPKHNTEIGGAQRSGHLDGLAADIDCEGTRERLLMVLAFVKAGFRRFELKRGNIHVDMKEGAPDMLTYLTDEGMV